MGLSQIKLPQSPTMMMIHLNIDLAQVSLQSTFAAIMGYMQFATITSAWVLLIHSCRVQSFVEYELALFATLSITNSRLLTASKPNFITAYFYSTSGNSSKECDRRPSWRKPTSTLRSDYHHPGSLLRRYVYMYIGCEHNGVSADLLTVCVGMTFEEQWLPNGTIQKEVDQDRVQFHVLCPPFCVDGGTYMPLFIPRTEIPSFMNERQRATEQTLETPPRTFRVKGNYILI